MSTHNSIKLHSKFYAPFRVLDRIGNTAYKLLLPENSQLHNVFHVSQLKKHVGPHVVHTLGLPLIDEKGTIKVALEAILERWMIPRNNEPLVQWLIQWVNMPKEEATWEDASIIREIFPTFHP